jgi:hypothetical protein
MRKVKRSSTLKRRSAWSKRLIPASDYSAGAKSLAA